MEKKSAPEEVKNHSDGDPAVQNTAVRADLMPNPAQSNSTMYEQAVCWGVTRVFTLGKYRSSTLVFDHRVRGPETR